MFLLHLACLLTLGSQQLIAVPPTKNLLGAGPASPSDVCFLAPSDPSLHCSLFPCLRRQHPPQTLIIIHSFRFRLEANGWRIRSEVSATKHATPRRVARGITGTEGLVYFWTWRQLFKTLTLHEQEIEQRRSSSSLRSI